MPTVNKLMMFAIAVSDMPRAKAFYEDKLGLKVTSDFRQDNDHWWVSLAFAEGGVTVTLTTFHGNGKPGTMTLWCGTSDLSAAHKALGDKGVKVSDIKDDLHGPGSGVKWFNFSDPDGNLIHLEPA